MGIKKEPPKIFCENHIDFTLSFYVFFLYFLIYT